MHTPDGEPAPAPWVIGLAGGVASGKSAVARVLGAMGWLVIDFDALVQLQLREPGVREALVSWWGPEVLGPDGMVDRRAVARRVFAEPAERRRLEQFIHPLVWRTRAQAQAMARSTGAPGVVFDAPLLFEAGLDAECDAVIFVDTPLPLRQERARRTRGWGPEDLAAREAAQLSVEEKARRSRFVVQNQGPESELDKQVRRILATLSAER